MSALEPLITIFDIAFSFLMNVQATRHGKFLFILVVLPCRNIVMPFHDYPWTRKKPFICASLSKNYIVVQYADLEGGVLCLRGQPGVPAGPDVRPSHCRPCWWAGGAQHLLSGERWGEHRSFSFATVASLHVIGTRCCGSIYCIVVGSGS